MSMTKREREKKRPNIDLNALDLFINKQIYLFHDMIIDHEHENMQLTKKKRK